MRIRYHIARSAHRSLYPRIDRTSIPRTTFIIKFGPSNEADLLSSQTVPVTLVHPCLDLGEQFVEMAAEFRNAAESNYIDEPVLLNEGVEAYVAWLHRGAAGVDLEPGLVPWSAFWAVSEGKLIGVSSLRHALSPWLAEYGGHIGYRVRPSARGRGYGTEILRLTLQEAYRLAIDPALIVCEPENQPSVRVIQHNRGSFDRQVIREDQLVLNRYWVPTAPASETR